VPAVSESKGNGRRSSLWRPCLLTYVLSLFNFGAVYYTAEALGGLNGWSAAQFAGLYGWIDASTGLGNVYAWNFWQLSQKAEHMHGRARFNVTTFKMKWEGYARALAGLTLLIWAGLDAGVSNATAWFIPDTLLLVIALFCFSGVLARASIAWPQVDLVHLQVGWLNKEHKLPPLSIGTSFLQLWLTIAALPIVATISTKELYQPEIAPSTAAGIVTAVLALVTFALFMACWRGEAVRNVEAVTDSVAEKVTE
jgi:hypothetical protein